MDKILVEVYLPAAQKTFDMRIPADSKMGEINQLTAAIAAGLSDGSFRDSGESVLVNAESGVMYDVNMTVQEQGICNGTRFILI